MNPRIRVVALDLEGVLVSNALSLFVRDGVADLLEGVRALGVEIVMYSSAPPHALEAAVRLLVEGGDAPAWYLDVPRIHSPDGIKDLTRVVADWRSVLLVDDQSRGVVEAQRGQWIPVREWEMPYDADGELLRVLEEVRARIQGSRSDARA